MQHLDMLLEGKEAVLFDIDGTLIDSMGVWEEIDRIYLKRYGIEMPAKLPEILSGMSIAQTTAYFRDVLGVKETDEKMVSDWNELAYEQYSQHILPKKSALSFVEEIHDRGIVMAVGTSNTRALAEVVLKRLGFFEYFACMLTGEDVKKGKPDPYIYLETARRVKADPSRCIVFEDIPEGLMAGSRAGMKTCGVWDRFSLMKEEDKRKIADYYIRDFSDIFENRVEILRG